MIREQAERDERSSLRRNRQPCSGEAGSFGPTYVVGERAAKWSPSVAFRELASSLDKEGEGGQDLSKTCSVIDPQECWGKGVPLVLVGVAATETAKRRRMDELDCGCRSQDSIDVGILTWCRYRTPWRLAGHRQVRTITAEMARTVYSRSAAAA